MTPSRLRVLWWAVFALSTVPFIRWFVLGFMDQLTANPIEFVTRSTGTWTLVFLCITLAISPLRWLTGHAWWLRLRRMLGLWTFFYAGIHLMTWVWFDQWFEIGEMIKDVIKRPFITVGFAAVVLMLPMALSSNNFSMRRLGKRWHKLHKAIYLVAPLAILHYWWHKAAKNDLAEPMIYAFIVAVLLGWRLYRYWLQKQRANQAAGAAPWSTHRASLR